MVEIGEEGLICDAGSEVRRQRVGERDKRRADKIHGKKNKTKRQERYHYRASFDLGANIRCQGTVIYYRRGENESVVLYLVSFTD